MPVGYLAADIERQAADTVVRVAVGNHHPDLNPRIKLTDAEGSTDARITAPIISTCIASNPSSLLATYS